MTDVRPPSASLISLDEWNFFADEAVVAEQVRLPHDAMICGRRGADAPGGADAGWFFGGKGIYQTVWNAPRASKGETVALRFEGVQGDSVVFVNGHPVGEIRGGYTEFEFLIDDAVRWGAENEIRVEVDNSSQPNSRWYSGTGLYRPVWLKVLPPNRFTSDGVRIRTLDVRGSVATIEMTFETVGLGEVTAELWDENDELVFSESTGGAQRRIMAQVDSAHLWSAERPYRYRLVSTLRVGHQVQDVRTEMVGLRTVSVDAKRGLQINGEGVVLRGACIHHDNGILGAATHRSAEFRRIRLLKDAGFNAIRSAHNPMSRHLLDACDELGMYVLDEFADYWFVSKTAHDHSDRFRKTWRDDAAMLIEKDRNRPSVIMYAIGNEIPESATPDGVQLAREITAFFHAADPDRPVTLAVNIFLNVLVSLGASPYKESLSKEGVAAEKSSMAGSTEANVMVNQIGRMMDVVSRLPRADKASREAFGVVDVAGYNYGLARYKKDAKAYPHRVILGTETLPGDVARAWALVESIPSVIGDFVWTGWEYLGEAGVAVWVPGKRAGLSKPYPYLVAGPGMFDLTGRPDVSLRLAQAAWGTLSAPAIAVRPVDRSGEPVVKSAWRVTDAVESWAWHGCDGRKAEIQVYSSDDEVELFLNGRSLGRRPTGKKHGFLARFTVPYEPGELVAVATRDGRAVSRSALRSAGPALELRLASETENLDADGTDLAFVTIEVTDPDGVVEMLADQLVTLNVTGPATLIGFGTAAPAQEEPFTGNRHTTFRGRAQAILRSTGEPGTVRVTASAGTLASTELLIPAQRSGTRPVTSSATA